jgi:hypothetical protein
VHAAICHTRSEHLICCPQVDRSAAYAARWVAKSLVKAGLVRRVLVQVGKHPCFSVVALLMCSVLVHCQVSYAIGIAEPLSLFVEDYGTGKVSKEELLRIIKKNFDLRPGVLVKYAIIQPCFPACTHSHYRMPQVARAEEAYLPEHSLVRSLWPPRIRLGDPQGAPVCCAASLLQLISLFPLPPGSGPLPVMRASILPLRAICICGTTTTRATQPPQI